MLQFLFFKEACKESSKSNQEPEMFRQDIDILHLMECSVVQVCKTSARIDVSLDASSEMPRWVLEDRSEMRTGHRLAFCMFESLSRALLRQKLLFSVVVEPLLLCCTGEKKNIKPKGKARKTFHLWYESHFALLSLTFTCSLPKQKRPNKRRIQLHAMTSGSDTPPRLVEAPSLELLPSYLLVVDPDNCTGDGSDETGPNKPYRTQHLYSRVLPPLQLDGPQSSLSLSAKNKHGKGHHSTTYHATFTLPESPVHDFASDGGKTTVIAKLGFTSWEDREHMSNEAKILSQLTRKAPGQDWDRSYPQINSLSYQG